MQKIKYTIFLIILVVSSASAQVIGNEWIIPGASYVKFEVVEDGFYRVEKSELDAIGIATGTIDPRSFRLFRRGEDWSIDVSGEQDGSFDTGDYIEFYGQKNDAKDEIDLYLDSTFQMQEGYSMYTDTAAYFLTWGGVSGKRIEADVTSGVSSLSTSLTAHFDSIHVDEFNQGNEPNSFVFYSEGDIGEGWAGNSIKSGTTEEFNYTLSQTNIGDGSGHLSIRLVGRNNNEHKAELLIESGSNSILVNVDDFKEHEVKDVEVDLDPGFLQPDFSIKLTPQGVLGSIDFLALVSVDLEYNLTNDFSTQSGDGLFQQDGNVRNVLSFGTGPHKLYSFTDVSSFSFVGDVSGSQLISNDQSDIKSYFLRENGEFKTVGRISNASFSSYSTVPEYVIVSHPRIWTGAQEFETYKSSSEGGDYDAQLFNINELYNTYSYGDRNPLAIRRLIQDMVQVDTPQVLMLLGRGLTSGYSSDGNAFRKEGFDENKFEVLDLVPTWGTPGSDVLFTSYMGKGIVPIVPTGRLPADTDSEITGIINKEKAHVALDPTEDWRKNVIHLSGGLSSTEAQLFFDFVSVYESIIEGEFFGANVTTFTKKTDVPIESFNISEQVNNGVSLITYIGHSSPASIEIDLGLVSDDIQGYRNEGRYPILHLNGCNAGDMYRSVTSAEDWLMTPDRGALAVYSHSSFGYSGQLNLFTILFYQTAFSDPDFYGKTLGEIHQETIRKYDSVNNDTPLNHTQLTQWSFFGDPSLRFFAPDKTDLSIVPGSVTIENSKENERLTAKSDSINLSFIVKNTGVAVNGTVNVCISRAYDELESNISYDTLTINVPSTQDTVTVTLFNELENSDGLNFFEVFVDCNDAYDEYDETNNVVTTSFDLPSNGVDLIYPYPYAIIPSGTSRFVVESQDLEQSGGTTYELQIAADYLFSSLVLDTTITGGNIASLTDVILPVSVDTAVFYWRSKLSVGDGQWENASFSVISNKTGWGQFEYGQFRENDFDNIVKNDADESFRYDSVETFIKFETSGANQGDVIFNTNLIINGKAIVNNLTAANCDFPGILALAFDGETLSSYKGESNASYTGCGPDPKVVGLFRLEQAGDRANLKSYLDSIPVGDYVILLSFGDNRMDLIDTDLEASLLDLGNENLVTLPRGIPYAFIGEKGATSPYYENFLLDDSSKLSDSVRVSDISNFGSMTASEIGAGVTWESASWSFNSDTLETILLKIQQEIILLDSNEFKVDVVLPPAAFENIDPFVEYEVDLSDFYDKSLNEFDYWTLCYDPAPEGAVVSTQLDLASSITVAEGDSIKIQVPFVNISPYDFSDSVYVNWTLEDPSGSKEVNETVNLGLLNSLDTLFLDICVSATDINGQNKVFVEFNSTKLSEQNFSNNSVTLFVEVVPDGIPPVTEVYIDDVLATYEVQTSSSPQIDIVLIDDNEFAVKNDTVGIELFIAGPCEEDCVFGPLYFSNTTVTYNQQGDRFVIHYNPENLSSGQYYLNVKGADAFGNINEEFFESSFVVKTEKEISYFIPYPSPFSSNMRFAYTLNGDTSPESITVQILGMDGSLVREVTQDELGTLRPGDNLTDWSWDGTNSKGKPLSNGVYMYRVVIDGELVKHMSTGADEHFLQDWGTIEISR